MNFMFSWQEQYLTRSLRSLVRYCSCHSNIKFISSRHRVISSMYVRRKFDVWIGVAFLSDNATRPVERATEMRQPIQTSNFLRLDRTLSNDDGDAKDDALWKMNFYFTVEFRRWLDLFSASIRRWTCSSLICNVSVQFQKKIRKISRRRLRSPKHTELGNFPLSFYRGRLRNVPRIITHVHGYCSAH